MPNLAAYPSLKDVIPVAPSAASSSSVKPFSHLCDQCGMVLDTLYSLREHRNVHAFTRVAVRYYIQQKRDDGNNTFENPFSPEERLAFSKIRKERKKGTGRERKKAPNVINAKELDKLPVVKIFNVRTQKQLTKELHPIPEMPSNVIIKIEKIKDEPMEC